MVGCMTITLQRCLCKQAFLSPFNRYGSRLDPSPSPVRPVFLKKGTCLAMIARCAVGGNDNPRHRAFRWLSSYGVPTWSQVGSHID
jgi:hypothetical protein